MVDLVTAAFAQQLALALPAESAAGRRALVARAHRFIDENLRSPDLSSRTIAAAHFVSVRHLQKVFEAEGEPVASVVRNRCPGRRERPLDPEDCRPALAGPHLLRRVMRVDPGVSP